MSSFTPEQLQELEIRYGLVPLKEVLPVRDGVVTKDMQVWWRSGTGPVYEDAEYHWDNIKNNPDLYQLKSPVVAFITYQD
jgi:hypothetical protein